VSSDIIRKQHEEQRLRHAIDYVHSSTNSAKKITTSELARLNRIITAGEDTAWRSEPIVIKIPTGKVQNFSLISNPMDDARRILGQAYDQASNGNVKEAAVYAYLQLVEEHLFREANRRTAALAAQWLLNEYDLDIDAHKLLEIPVGDVRDASEKKQLMTKISQLIRES
jgi:prophage maintenance system killer protein